MFTGLSLGGVLLAGALSDASAADRQPVMPPPTVASAPDALATPSRSPGPASSVRGAPVPRPAEQTYLTFPEWFLVYSPSEYARQLANGGGSRFPYLGHVSQYWRSYYSVWAATRRDYPFNAGYHAMLMVIGVSTSIEYSLRAAYETLIGRLTEPPKERFTAEDDFAVRVAQDYVDFIRLRPWYEFDFFERVRQLWEDLPNDGPITGLLRKWERRWALTTEFGFKALYASLIGKLAEMTYEAEATTTHMLVDRVPADLRSIAPAALAAGGQSLVLPRYQLFTDSALALARRGVNFHEIAGNRGIITVSVLTDENWAPTRPIAQTVVHQPILTEPGRKRLVLAVTVAQLADALRGWQDSGAEIEHIYDF